jgi:hypothetical protein
VPNPGLTDFQRADPRQQVTFGQVTVTDHHGSTRCGSLASVSLQIFLHLVFDGRLEHLARPFSDELFQRSLGLNFSWLLKRENFIFFQRCILSVVAASGEASRIFWLLEGCALSYRLIHNIRSYLGSSPPRLGMALGPFGRLGARAHLGR